MHEPDSGKEGALPPSNNGHETGSSSACRALPQLQVVLVGLSAAAPLRRLGSLRRQRTRERRSTRRRWFGYDGDAGREREREREDSG